MQYEAVYPDRFLAVQNPFEVFRVKFPPRDYHFQGIYFYGVAYGCTLGRGVGIARNEGADRGEGYQRVKDKAYNDRRHDCADDEFRFGKTRHNDRPVRLVVHEAQSEIPDFPGFVLHIKFLLPLYLVWTES